MNTSIKTPSVSRNMLKLMVLLAIFSIFGLASHAHAQSLKLERFCDRCVEISDIHYCQLFVPNCTTTDLIAGELTGHCSEIRPLFYHWDLGYPGGSQFGSDYITVDFPEPGTYTVTITMVYKDIATGRTCSTSITGEVDIDFCGPPVSDQ